MTISLLIFFAISALATVAICLYLVSKHKAELRQILLDKDILKNQYDNIRKEKIDLEDKVIQAQSQEKTFKVAYEDWKTKYDLLEEKYMLMRRELELSNLNSPSSLESNKLLTSAALLESKPTEPNNTKLQITNNKEQNQPVTERNVINELKQILDQHLQIISGMIAEDKSPKMPEEPKADPLYLIDGIDQDIFEELKTMGIFTFEDLAEVPRKDIKKWILHFEDMDEKIIEAWPYQAKAIINYAQHLHED